MATITIRVSDDLKSNAQKLFESLGMDLTTAITVFLSQSVRDSGIPFRIGTDVPNAETISAMKECREIEKSGKYRFSSADTMLKELNSDVEG